MDDFATASQTGDDLAGALGAVQAVVDDGLAADTYYYWVQAFSASGLSSTPTASQSSTVA